MANLSHTAKAAKIMITLETDEVLEKKVQDMINKINPETIMNSPSFKRTFELALAGALADRVTNSTHDLNLS